MRELKSKRPAQMVRRPLPRAVCPICLHLCIVIADVEALQKTSPLYTAARAGDHPRVVELLQYQHVRSDVDVGKRSGGCAGRLGALGAPTLHSPRLLVTYFACTVGIRVEP